MIPYGRQWIEEDDIEAVVEVLHSDWLTTGPRIDAYEQAFAETVGARYAVAVSSGTAGLHLACLAAGVSPGDRCVTSSLTFVATSNAAIYCGAIPVFTDVEEDSLNMDPQKLEGSLKRDTAAILPVHFAGLSCDMGSIGEIAERHGVIVIEDACHALGASAYSPSLPTIERNTSYIGDCRHSLATVFSTHPVKAIATGEGGVVTTNDARVNDRLRLLRSHGITRDKELMSRDEGPWYYEMVELGFNYRITDIQCALGASQLKKLARFMRRRTEIAARYSEAFSSLTEISLPLQPQDGSHAWHLYVIRLKGALAGRRCGMFDGLRARGILANVHYVPVYLQPYYRKRFGFEPGLCPVAEAAYASAISLPMFPALTDEQIEIVIRSVHDLYHDLSLSSVDAAA